MVIYKNLNRIIKLNKSTLTLGSFDGFHLGHIKIIKHLKLISNNKSIPTVVITFDPHPKKILSPNKNNIKILQSLNEKIDFLKKMNIDYLLIIPFNKKMSEITAKDFLDKYMINYFNPSDILVGNDHRFGYNQEGDINYLLNHKINYGYTLHVINSAIYHNYRISSTLIRRYIQNGNIEKANECLGRNYELNGTIIKGNGMGTQIGFPTINIKPIHSDQIIPFNGVYSVDIIINNKTYAGMCNIGTRPTFYENGPRNIEIHLLDEIIPKINNKTLKILFQKYLRKEKKYESSKDLIIQLEVDRNDCINMKNFN